MWTLATFFRIRRSSDRIPLRRSNGLYESEADGGVSFGQTSSSSCSISFSVENKLSIDEWRWRWLAFCRTDVFQNAEGSRARVTVEACVAAEKVAIEFTGVVTKAYTEEKS